MKPVPRMQDVDTAAGCSRAAVSMALRGDPSIPEATRRRIRTVAEQIGYRPSPLVAALMSLRRRRRATLRETTAIAFFDYDDPLYVNTVQRPVDSNILQPARVATPSNLYYLTPRNYTLTAALRF